MTSNAENPAMYELNGKDLAAVDFYRKKARAENLSVDEIKSSDLFEQFYKDVVTKWFLPSDFPIMELKGSAGSGKTFLIKKIAQEIPLKIYGLGDNFTYTLINESDAPSAIVLDDTHYFLDLCRFNELNGQKPNTTDFANTLEDIVLKNKGVKIILASDRGLYDLAAPIKSAEDKKKFLQTFGDLACTPDDQAYFAHQTGAEIKNPKGCVINFRDVGEICVYGKNLDTTINRLNKDIYDKSQGQENVNWRHGELTQNLADLEKSVRKQLNLENIPVVFDSMFTEHKPRAGGNEYTYRVPSLAGLDHLNPHYRATGSHFNAIYANNRQVESAIWAHNELCPIRALIIAKQISGKKVIGAEDFGITPTLSQSREADGTYVVSSYQYTYDQARELYQKLTDLAKPYKKWPKKLVRMVADGDIEQAFVLRNLSEESNR